MEARYVMVLLVSSSDCNLDGKECMVSVARPLFIFCLLRWHKKGQVMHTYLVESTSLGCVN